MCPSKEESGYQQEFLGTRAAQATSLPSTCAVQDDLILLQGFYTILAVPGYRIRAKGHPRLYYLIFYFIII